MGDWIIEGYEGGRWLFICKVFGSDAKARGYANAHAAEYAETRARFVG